LKGHGDAVLSLAFSSDGRRIVSGSSDKTIRVWDANTGKEVAEPLKSHTGFVLSVAFSPDGDRIVSGSEDATIQVHGVSGSKVRVLNAFNNMGPSLIMSISRLLVKRRSLSLTVQLLKMVGC